jgi:hypothetical protein
VLSDWVKAGEDWIEQDDYTSLWAEDGWKSKPFVHFANRVALAHDKVPRWQFLNAILNDTNDTTTN